MVLKLSNMKQNDTTRDTFRPFRLSLTKLYINDCGLRNLDADTFKDFTKVTVLSLRNNSITHLPDTIVTSLTRLTTLDLSENELNVISDTVLRPLHKLEYLFFSDHMNFGEEFVNMTRLRHIDFSDGTIWSLNRDTFRYLSQCPITDIRFRICNIYQISKDTFLPLRDITSLSFVDMYLSTSHLQNVFYGLKRTPLRRLCLSSLDLTHYSAAFFEGLKQNNITNLVMNASGITVIKKGLFNNLGTVSSLDLSDNKIKNLEDDSFKDLVKLPTLIIDKYVLRR